MARWPVGIIAVNDSSRRPMGIAIAGDTNFVNHQRHQDRINVVN